MKVGHTQVKHTQGDWVAKHDGFYFSIGTESKSSKRMHDYLVCKTDGNSLVDEANARLIAQAPAMYEALTAIKDHLISSTAVNEFEDKNGLIVPKTDMLLYIDKVLGIDADGLKGWAQRMKDAPSHTVVNELPDMEVDHNAPIDAAYENIANDVERYFDGC